MEVLRFFFLLYFVYELEGLAVNSTDQSLLFILVDGMRYDYMDNVDTPNLDKMAEQGVKVDYLVNVFPTMVPSKVSLVTGLYPEYHGFVHNKMYDSVHDVYAKSTNKKESYWWNSGIAEPIWVTARKQGKISGSIDYFGGFAEIAGFKPNNFTDNPYATLRMKMDIAIDWLKDGMDVAVVEWKQLDFMGHIFGPTSKELEEKFREFDQNIGYLRQKIREFEMEDKVNIVVAGDHGMTEVSNKTVITLSDFINLDDTKAYIADSPVAMILPKEGFLGTIYNQLVNAHPNMKVYKKENIPEYYHYGGHYRVLPIVAIADLPWMILSSGTDVGQKADHGFYNQEKSMKSLMLAEGPAFKTNFSINSLDAIDLYELMCNVLQLEPAPNNGSLVNIKDILADTKSTATVCEFYSLLYIVIFVLFFSQMK